MKLHKNFGGCINSVWLEGEKFNYQLELMFTPSNVHIIPTFHIYLGTFSYRYDQFYIGFNWLKFRLTFSIEMDTKKWCERNGVK